MRRGSFLDRFHTRALLWLLAFSMAAAGGAWAGDAADEQREGLDGQRLFAVWDDGLEIRDVAKEISIGIGGRVQNDWGLITADDDLDLLHQEDSLEGFGTQIRRFGMLLEGRVYQWWEFGIGVELSGGDIFIEDAWVGVRDVAGLEFIRVGHQKEPFSLEEQTSDLFTTFMERGLPNVFVPSWNTGVHVAGTGLDRRLTWAVGLFEESDGSGSSDPFDDIESLNVTGRVTGLPWRRGETGLLHLGLSYSRQFRDREESERTYEALPETNLPDAALVDTGLFSAGDADLVGLEAAFVLGRISLQGEYMNVSISRSGENPRFHGYYVFVSHFLTGESRSYDASRGVFGRVGPIQRFDPGAGGWGAWEVAARYSFVDLDDAGIQGGEQRNVSLALNWYPNSMVRVMLNYVHAEVDRTLGEVEIDGSGADIVQIRVQMDL
jgi:phosphate-selective porin OprO and OprP